MTTEQDLRARIAELEKALEGAIWFTDGEENKVRKHYRIGGGPAQILLFLYRAHGPISAKDLNDVIVTTYSPHAFRRIDPEFRQHKSVHTWISNLRKRFGKDLIGCWYSSGYWLTDKGREFVRQALEA